MISLKVKCFFFESFWLIIIFCVSLYQTQEVHIDLSRMLQSEIDEEQACDDELIKSPTEDFHRPKVHFPSFREEDEEAAGNPNSQGVHNIWFDYFFKVFKVKKIEKFHSK